MKKQKKKEYDKHRATASKVFKVAEKEITEEQRRLAKIMNFGVIYGSMRNELWNDNVQG